MAAESRWSILIPLLLLDACAGGFRACQGPPSRLLGDLRSNSAVSTIKAQASPGWRVVREDPPRTQSERRPPFVQLEAEITDFEASGSRGTLQLHFTNDRLMTVIFSPPDPERVFSALATNAEVTREGASILHVPAATEIRLLTTQGRTAIMAQDECLARESDDWVRRYASIRQSTACMG